MGAWPVYYVWPMPSHFIFESPDNWLNTHKADLRWPIIILLIGRDGQSRGQRALGGGVLDFTHRIPTAQCTLGFVKRNYWTESAGWKLVKMTFMRIHSSMLFYYDDMNFHIDALIWTVLHALPILVIIAIINWCLIDRKIDYCINEKWRWKHNADLCMIMWIS